MLLGRSQDAQSRGVGGISSGLGIELFPQPAKILRLVVDNRKHPAKEEQVARLHRLDVSAKRRRGGWELNAKVLQPAFGAARLRTFTRLPPAHVRTVVHVQHLPGDVTELPSDKRQHQRCPSGRRSCPSGNGSSGNPSGCSCAEEYRQRQARPR